MTAAAPSVSPLFRLTVRMLLPLPGSSGHQTEQMPISSPAAAIAGISSQELTVLLAVRRHETVECKPRQRQRRQHKRESREQIGQLGVRPVQRSCLVSDR